MHPARPLRGFLFFSLGLLCLAALALPLAAALLLRTAGLPPLPSWLFQPPLAPGQARADHLSLLHRSGQTFITWDERLDLTGERYRIYRHTAPITSANLASATRLYEVGEGSARFYANRYPDDGGTWQSRYLERYVITPRGSELPAGTGLLVWTLAAADFSAGGSGNAYYAVTVVPSGGSELLESGYSAGALGESLADPQPVELANNVGSGGRVYIQYMDLRHWNPTFHAPNALNAYYGLDPADPQVANAVQYAYDYVVYEPRAASCGGSQPSPAPVFLYLHGWAGNAYPPLADFPDDYYCAYAIYPVDTNQTWWFGFARDHDFRQEGEPAAGDTVVNYTEQRLLRMIGDLQRLPPGPPVDPQRIYVYGHSMGGSGALNLALHFPNVFAAAYASEPMTDYRTSGDGGGVDWRGDLSPKWGSPALNLPVQLDAPHGWAAHLAAYNGLGVWDWQDHQAQLQSRLGAEMAPFGVAHGLLDTVIEWSTQGAPAYPAFNASRRAWGGAVVNADHTWLGYAGFPPTLGQVDYAPFYNFQVRRDESLPGLSSSSADSPLPPAAPGGYNQTLHWSSSWAAWDDAPIDTADLWQISLCPVVDDGYDDNPCGSGPAQTVDVTPRRLQRFLVVPGETYAWENRRVSDNSLVASGLVSASPAGVLTVPGFSVSGAGNRLSLRHQGGPLPTHTPTPTFTPTPGSPADHLLHLPLVLRQPAPLTPATSTPTPTATPTPTPTPTTTPSPGGPRPWPDTTSGIHVFNDQLSNSMSAAQRQFAAAHYAGTQKMTRSDADLLRQINPNFLILHYRLGLGLGYRAIQSGCQPTGDWLRIIEGDDWVVEWPAAVQETWLYHWPEAGADRLLNCDWGWYTAELNDPGWRAYWAGEVLRQVNANDDDGLFMDSLSVPNYLGHDHFSPALPAVDAAFESAWAARIHDWLAWLQTQAIGSFYLVPNAGAWINGRDDADYSPADGVMVEGFALEADASPYNLDDWRLQMDRSLGMIAQDKALIAQAYVFGGQERMFTLGSYLLIKGSRTYLNLELDLPPEWWPEYDIPIGAPLESAGTDIQNLYDPVNQVYRRDFSNGLVLVNPTSPYDGSGRSVTYELGGSYSLAVCSGGGELPSGGVPTGSLTYQSVTQVTLPPFTAAVLLSPP